MVQHLLEVPEANCPHCGAERVTWGTRFFRGAASLLTGRLLSRWLRRLIPLPLRCRVCACRFELLHVLPRTVVGYHGCRRDFARNLVAGKVSTEAWKLSPNDYDWLGEGIYFWEHAPGRAWQWARERYKDEGAVVAAEIQLGCCLDLADTGDTDLLREVYRGTVELYERNGWPLPKNGGRDFKLRRLDRLVIDRLTRAADRLSHIHYQTVRCPFEEGEPVYDGGMIKTQSHIQIAVRDRRCIASRIYPLSPGGGVG